MARNRRRRLDAAPVASESIDVDVAILGAGFSGLWTAWYLKERDSSLEIAIIEREIAGFGASGRNGAWCTSEFPTGPGALAHTFGDATARTVVNAMRETVAEIKRVTEAEGITCDWADGGQLIIARGPQQRPAVDDEYQTMQRLGLADGLELLDADQARQRLNVTN